MPLYFVCLLILYITIFPYFHSVFTPTLPTFTTIWRAMLVSSFIIYIRMAVWSGEINKKRLIEGRHFVLSICHMVSDLVVISYITEIINCYLYRTDPRSYWKHRGTSLLSTSNWVTNITGETPSDFIPPYRSHRYMRNPRSFLIHNQTHIRSHQGVCAATHQIQSFRMRHSKYLTLFQRGIKAFTPSEFSFVGRRRSTTLYRKY